MQANPKPSPRPPSHTAGPPAPCPPPGPPPPPQVPITTSLLYRLGSQYRHLLSNLAGSMWAGVASWVHESGGNEPYYVSGS